MKKEKNLARICLTGLLIGGVVTGFVTALITGIPGLPDFFPNAEQKDEPKQPLTFSGLEDKESVRITLTTRQDSGLIQFEKEELQSKKANLEKLAAMPAYQIQFTVNRETDLFLTVQKERRHAIVKVQNLAPRMPVSLRLNSQDLYSALPADWAGNMVFPPIRLESEQAELCFIQNRSNQSKERKICHFIQSGSLS